VFLVTVLLAYGLGSDSCDTAALVSKSLTVWTDDRGDGRLPASYAASALVHLVGAVLLWWAGPLNPPPPEEKRISIELVAQGRGPQQHAAMAVQPPSAPPSQPTPVRPRPKAPPAPRGTVPLPLPVDPSPAPVPAPVSPVQSPTTSFRDWQAARMDGVPLPSGGRGGTDLVSSKGKDRCEPARASDLVILLYDASGSMADTRRAQGIHCARQYAQGAIARGAQVVVGSFGLTSAFSPPTRDVSDIDFALRAQVDARGTVLPARELFPWIDNAQGKVMDLVIVSDGYIPPSREVVDAYSYFLDLHPQNRGVMYTVGQPGQRAIENELRDLGFDVFVYQQLGGG